MIQKRTKRNSSKVSLTISVMLHAVLILVAFVFAAREGMLGKKLKQMTATMVPKKKKPEPPKPKAEEPKPEPAKLETPKINVPQPNPQPAPAPPSAIADTAPAAAPAAAVVSGFEFGGGKAVIAMGSDPRSIYKAKVERALRERWVRPLDLDDANFLAKVELTVDKSGRVVNYQWLSGSGNARWDNSVKAVLEATPTLSAAPPKDFPESFEVRFDVETTPVETVQLSRS